MCWNNRSIYSGRSFIGVEDILKMINLDLFAVEDAIEIAAEAVSAYIKQLNEVKPEVICVADPTSSGVT